MRCISKNRTAIPISTNMSTGSCGLLNNFAEFFDQMRPDQIKASAYVRIKVYPHNFEARLLHHAVSGSVRLIDFVNGSSFVLEVWIGVFAVYVEDNLADWKSRKSIWFEWIEKLGDLLRIDFVQLVCRLLTHGDGGFNNLLNCVRLACPSHAEKGRSFTQKISRAHVNGDLRLLFLETER